MPRLDSAIVEHKLPLRRIKHDVSLKVKEEIQIQFEAVPVLKKDGKVRMCVHYRDLNRANPKGDFPLPHIDVLVDKTTQHSYFSFMDGFSRYNQIKMALEDMEKQPSSRSRNILL
ncbi:hypothetical protein CR513_50061, partial [Mucuna pruriens]